MTRGWTLALLLLCGCRSIEITPAVIRSAGIPADQERAVRELWSESVERINVFMASDYRRSLPPGHFELDEAQGMRFVPDGLEPLPIQVRNTSWGVLLGWTGSVAQERSWGFVVGSRAPEQHPVIDNGLFRYLDGSFKSAESIARLILHESGHVYHREGTVGFWNGVGYYLEAIFLLRASKHSAERRPRAVAEEYGMFELLRGASRDDERTIYRQAFEDHLRESDGRSCEHGPYE